MVYRCHLWVLWGVWTLGGYERNFSIYFEGAAPGFSSCLFGLVVKRDAQIIEKRENGCGARESSIPLIFDSLRKAKFFFVF